MGEITGYQGWTSGSQTRGTLDVLWTSLSTLALCVWTAVHPNITLSPSTSRNLLHRVGMMVLAIIFPELIISAAWRQLSVAQKLCSKTRKLRIDSRNREIVCSHSTSFSLILKISSGRDFQNIARKITKFFPDSTRIRHVILT